MGPSIIARNYAETLLELARRNGGDSAIDEFGHALADVAEILRREPLVREFLETPRVDAAGKKKALEASFAGRVPEVFLRFLNIVVDKRRQSLLVEISEEYQGLVDEIRGRARAEVVIAREPDEALRQQIVSSLEKRLGRSVVPAFTVDRSLVGGIVIKYGSEILDGSLQRRIVGLRRRMLERALPAASAAGSEFQVGGNGSPSFEV